ncbi:MAG: hypothetical protein WCS87_04440 [Methylococcaceae bacterium]
MTTITLDDALINEMIAVGHFNNAQEALTKIIAFYLQQHEQQPTFFEQLCLTDDLMP